MNIYKYIHMHINVHLCTFSSIHIRTTQSALTAARRARGRPARAARDDPSAQRLSARATSVVPPPCDLLSHASTLDPFLCPLHSSSLLARLAQAASGRTETQGHPLRDHDVTEISARHSAATGLPARETCLAALWYSFSSAV